MKPNPDPDRLIETAPIIIGIDPGVSTGVAEYDRRTMTWSLRTSTFWEVYEWIRGHDLRDSILVIVEDPAANRPVFDRGVAGRKAAHIAQSVGGVKREATLFVEGLQRLGVAVIARKPVRAAKWTAEDLKRITGVSARSSEHARDAARLAEMFARVRWRPGV